MTGDQEGGLPAEGAKVTVYSLYPAGYRPVEHYVVEKGGSLKLLWTDTDSSVAPAATSS